MHSDATRRARATSPRLTFQRAAGGKTIWLGSAPGSLAMSDGNLEFTSLFRAEYEQVVRTVYLIVHDRDRANDITQDAFMELLTRWNRIARYERPDAWVRRVAIRMAVRLLYRERRRAQLEREINPATSSQPADLDVMRAIQRLPATQRSAIVLFYFEDRPVAEVAYILALSPGAAKSTLHRARKRLAEVLGEEEPTGADDVS